MPPWCSWLSQEHCSLGTNWKLSRSLSLLTSFESLLKCYFLIYTNEIPTFMLSSFLYLNALITFCFFTTYLYYLLSLSLLTSFTKANYKVLAMFFTDIFTRNFSKLRTISSQVRKTLLCPGTGIFKCRRLWHRTNVAQS